ncbi:signal transduction histidine kinase [Pseudoduganella lurida]|uniref:histidine kinase n=1 Tax=Pseudoduganella lurida TaxID=1036180 RepID=A0A562R8K8_9BURK|nr:HAMP domain-containing sensor histidine kinase [Pseudoduganella lurida]TWI65391.1 signal transduction histidine kinase [Pseudoduganella lurida]
MTLATDQQPEREGFSPTSLQFLSMRDAVMDHWEREVRAQVAGASDLLGPVLTNTLPAFYDNIAEALSPGHPRENATSDTNAASAHGGERARMTPYGPDQVIHEYQLLRAAIAAVAQERLTLGPSDWTIIDDSIDEAMRQAIRAFTRSHDELRRKVAAALSHDMRTPLSVVLTGAQLIGIAPSMDIARNTASKIAANAVRLRDMMGDLLDTLTYHGDASIPLDLSQFDVFELVKELRDQYCQSREGTLDFEAVGEAVVGFWDRGSMHRALENLVNNAVKYGDGGKIKIKACETRGRLMLSVHNDGRPIPPDQHDRIFEYLRREGGSPAAAGWGIGLPFVKMVAQSHGGTVAVDSSGATGTTFLIDIPVDCRPFVGGGEGQLPG